MAISSTRIREFLEAIYPFKPDSVFCEEIRIKIRRWKIEKNVTAAQRVILNKEFEKLFPGFKASQMCRTIVTAEVRADMVKDVERIMTSAQRAKQALSDEGIYTKFFAVTKSLVSEFMIVLGRAFLDEQAFTLRRAADLCFLHKEKCHFDALHAVIISIYIPKFDFVSIFSKCAEYGKQLEYYKVIRTTVKPRTTRNEYLDFCELLGVQSLEILPPLNVIIGAWYGLDVQKNANRFMLVIKGLLGHQQRVADVDHLNKTDQGRGAGGFMRFLANQSEWCQKLIIELKKAAMCIGFDTTGHGAEKYLKKVSDDASVFFRFMYNHVRQKYQQSMAESDPMRWFYENGGYNMFFKLIAAYCLSRKQLTKKRPTMSRRQQSRFAKSACFGVRLITLLTIKMIANRKCVKELKANDIIIKCKRTSYQTIKKPEISPLPTLITPEMLETLVEAANNVRDKFLLLFIFNVGPRSSETGRLRWKDLIKNGEPQQVLAFYQKGGGVRTFTMAENILPTIMEYYSKYTNDLVPGKDCYDDLYAFNPINPNQPLDSGSIYLCVARIVARAKVDHRIYPHLFRHAMTTKLYNLTNGDILMTAQMTGHKSIEVTRNYIINTGVTVNAGAVDPDAQSIKSAGNNISRLLEIFFQKIDAGASDSDIVAMSKEMTDEARRFKNGSKDVNDDDDSDDEQYDHEECEDIVDEKNISDAIESSDAMDDYQSFESNQPEQPVTIPGHADMGKWILDDYEDDGEDVGQFFTNPKLQASDDMGEKESTSDNQASNEDEFEWASQSDDDDGPASKWQRFE